MLISVYNDVRLFSPQVQEFFENGLCNILRLIPRNLDDEERLFIEAVIYTGYGYFRSYQMLEKLLDENTSDCGEFPDSYVINRDTFLYAWSMIDSAYAIDSLSKLKVAKKFLTLSSETKFVLREACNLRNYMDHLSANFGNSVKANDFAPLFGWMTYQTTPCLRGPGQSLRTIIVTNVASTHLGKNYTISAPKCASAEVFAGVGNIMLHVRRNDRAQLSIILGNLTLDLNQFSIDVQQYLVSKLEDQTFDHGGLRVPFPRVVATTELPEDVIRQDITAPLNENKFRAQISLEPTSVDVTSQPQHGLPLSRE